MSIRAAHWRREHRHVSRTSADSGRDLVGAGRPCGLLRPLDRGSTPAARVQLLSLIAGAENGEACACDLIEPVRLSQPTVSHHLKILLDAGLVSREQRGKWAYYRVAEATLDAVSAALRPFRRP